MRNLIYGLIFLAMSSRLPAGVVTEAVFLNGSTAQSAAGNSVVTFLSNTLTDTDTGVSFRIQFDATASGIAEVELPSSDLGVDSLPADAGESDQFDAAGDIVTFDNLSIVSFNDNGSGLTVADLSDIGFNEAVFAAAGANSDAGEINNVAFSDVGTAPQSFATTSSVTIEWTGGVWRLNSIGVTATATAVPEPSSLAACVLLSAVALRRRRRS